MSSYLLAVAVAVVVLAAAVLVPFLSVSAHASFPQWLSDHFYFFLPHTLSFLHLSCCLHFLTSNQWLVCFTLLGWDLNYSALRIIFVVSISRVDPKKVGKFHCLESANWIYWGERCPSCWGALSIHTEIDIILFGLFFQMRTWSEKKIVNFCEDVVNLNVLYTAII